MLRVVPAATVPLLAADLALVVPALLLALVLLGGGTVFWGFHAGIRPGRCIKRRCKRLRPTRACGGARSADHDRPAGRLLDYHIGTRASPIFAGPLSAPRAAPKAHVQARLNDATWELVILEVVLPTARRYRWPMRARRGAPSFEGSKPETKKPEADAPAPDINLPAPPDDRPEK